MKVVVRTWNPVFGGAIETAHGESGRIVEQKWTKAGVDVVPVMHARTSGQFHSIHPVVNGTIHGKKKRSELLL